MNKLEKYSSYKDSGVEWLGEVPEHWEVKRIKFVMNKIQTGTTPSTSNKNFFDGNLNWFNPKDLNQEILIESENKLSQLALDRKEIKLFQKDSILIVAIGATTGKTSYLTINGTFNQQITGFYSKTHHNKLLFYTLRSLSNIFLNVASYTTLPILNNEFFRSFSIVLPPKEEQIKIASFLDEKTEQLDKAISQKEKLIELLKERKQIVINESVTKGLDKDVEFVDSGVEWIGEIPKHWEIEKAKYLFKEIDERSMTGKEELLSVSHLTGVTRRSEKNVSMFMSEDYTGSKTCKKDDLVMNIMWAWMGALGISTQEGIVSPSYAVYRQLKKELNSKYIEYLLKTPKYIEHYNRVSTGLHSSRLRFYSHMFMRMKIGFPFMTEQVEIVEYITIQTTKIDKAIELQQNYIQKLKEYKATLIDSVVTGKVRVS